MSSADFRRVSSSILFVACAGACGPIHAATPAIAAPSWSALRSAYSYKAPAPTVAEQPLPDPNNLRIHIRFTNIRGQSVPGIFIRPKANGVYPCVLLPHGLGSDKETMAKYFGGPLASQGVASLALDSNLHGERKVKDMRPASSPLALGMVIHDSVTDYRQAMDYLATRKDIDSKRIGLLGYSMGAMIGSITSGVDDRVKATVLCVGGDPVKPLVAAFPVAFRMQVEEVSPSNYVGHISPRPVLMINGSHDTVMNEAAARSLQNAAHTPKEVIWANSGHMLPEAELLQAGRWLLKQLDVK